MKTIASALLGHVHGLIGMTQEGFSVFVIEGKQRDANAGKHMEVLAMQQIRRRHRTQHPVQRRTQFRQITDMTQHQHKLVARQARHHIFATHDLAQTPGHLDQQHITAGMPVAVVDRFKPVEVKHAHRQRDVFLAGELQRLIQQVREIRAIG
ncbi:hypothetical protein D3C84_964210 [compost metagenome]